MKKFLALLLAVTMVLSMAACGSKDTNNDSTAPTTTGETAGTEAAAGGEHTYNAVGGDYTYNAAVSALATNWNPHSWEMDADDTIRSYLSTGFVDLSIDNSEDGVYQWIYEMATSIEDVTADHQDDLVKYGSILPKGTAVEDVTERYVYEIKLNPDAKWEDGTPINADSYIYSMKQLLNPEMQNYRANLYWSGESAVAGGDAYYHMGQSIYVDAAGAYALEDLVKNDDGTYSTAEGYTMFLGIDFALAQTGGDTLKDYVDAYGDTYFDVTNWGTLVGMADSSGLIPLTDENLELFTPVTCGNEAWGETEADLPNYFVYFREYPECEYDDTVGCYKVDDYTIRYVMQTAQELNYFLVSCTTTWLVYEDLYEAGKNTAGTLTTTDYCTSVETTMSYGPYKLQSVQDGKQMVLVQNENWFGYEKQEDGYLVSYTNFDVDGAPVQQYQTTKIVIDVMDTGAQKQAFLKGELMTWEPEADDLLTYSTSDRLTKVPETFTMSFFFNCDLDNLKAMDESKGNTNSVVLSNENFRKAWSLAVDREKYVSATEGYTPAFALMNDLYFYDVYNDPESSYRGSDAAMQAVCNLYGVEYGDGTPYATLKDAYKSINGYNLTQAQELMKTACEELVAEGLYTEGEPITIRIGWSAGAIESAAQNQVKLMNEFLNAAVEGSGFGTITLEAIGNLTNRYDDVVNGEYAVGYGAWGGAAFYPFRNMQVYCNTDQYTVHESGSWDPSTETLTLNVNGEDVTMTWKDWSNALIGTGKFAGEDNEVKLEITAQLEELFLEKYYRIPLCATTICSMLSYKADYYTENYNIMYNLGGIRLMTYNYNDAEWAEYVASEGGTLSYE